MLVYLDDISGSENFFPFNQVKSVVHIRLGINTIYEKWQRFFPNRVVLKSDGARVRAHSISFSAFKVPSNKTLHLLSTGHDAYEDDFVTLENSADIFKYNDWALRQDFELLTKHRKSDPLPSRVFCSSPDNVFLEPNVQIAPCFINADAGPVYIAEGVQIMEGAMLRGPLFVGKHSVIKMGAKIYGSTTVGPYCMAGGEVKNSVLMGFSNKAHDGYLGDSVLGEWCNLGAGTSNSNLKNNASEVSIQLGADAAPMGVGIKCGLLMGDYSRSAVNTVFNTGTVVGVSCNIFGDNPPKFVPSFTWGNDKYVFEKAIEHIDNWKKLKGFAITDEEKNILRKIYK